MANPIDILINIKTSAANAGLNVFKNQLILLKTTIASAFRTTVVAAFFMAIRTGVMTFQSLKSGISNLVGEFAKLSDQAGISAAVMSEGGKGFAEALKGITKLTADASAASRYSMQDINEGIFTAAQAGYNLADSMKVAKVSMDLALVSGENFKMAISGLISITKQFSINTGDIGKSAAVMTAAISSSKMTLDDFYQAMRYAGPAAAAAFGDTTETLRQTAAALAVMHDVGIESGKAGTYLRSAILGVSAPTPKVMGVFSKYDINPFEATGDSSKYVAIMQKGMKATGELSDKMTKLKEEQFALALSGKTNTIEYQNLLENIDKTSAKINELETGMSDVKDEFNLAGGKLKSLVELFSELATKAPIEVVGRAFGIRTGQGITVLLQQIDKLKAKDILLKRVQDEAQKGKNILSDMVDKVSQSLLHKWMQLKNTVFAIFSPIFTSLAKGFAPVLDTALKGFEQIRQWVNSNTRVFDNLFVNMGSNLNNILKNAMPQLTSLIKGLNSTSMVSSYKKFSAKDGALVSEDISVKTPISSFEASIKSIGTLIRATIANVFESLKPEIEGFSMIFSEIFVTQVLLAWKQVEASLKGMGATVGKDFGNGFKDAMMNSMSSIGEYLKAALKNILRSVFFGQTFDSSINVIKGAPEGLSTAGRTIQKNASSVLEMSPASIIKNISSLSQGAAGIGTAALTNETINKGVWDNVVKGSKAFLDLIGITGDIKNATDKWESSSILIIDSVKNLQEKTKKIEAKAKAISKN